MIDWWVGRRVQFESQGTGRSSNGLEADNEDGRRKRREIEIEQQIREIEIEQRRSERVVEELTRELESSEREMERLEREMEERRRGLEEERRGYEQSQTPFMRALFYSNVGEAQRLLEQGDVGNVNAVDSVRFVVVLGGTKRSSGLFFSHSHDN